MRNKQYYQLSELLRNTNICREDFEYIIENYKEDLFLKVYDQPVLLIESMTFVRSEEALNEVQTRELSFDDELDAILESIGEQSGNRGLLVGRYSGLVRLEREDRNQILRSGSAEVHHVRLDSKSGLKFKYLSLSYPFETQLPNDIIKEWAPEPIDSIQDYGIEAFFILSDKGRLKLQKRKFAVDCLVVPDFQIESINSLLTTNWPTELSESEVSSHPEPINNPEPSEQKRQNDLTEILIKIIKDRPDISAKHVWSILEKETDMDEEERHYDKYGVLKVYSEGEIAWESRYKNRSYFKFSSLGPTISRLKKALKTN